jgi:hypothetical protein
MPDAHRRREDRAAVLEEKGDVGRERAGQSEGESDDHVEERPLEARRVSRGRHRLRLIRAELMQPTSWAKRGTKTKARALLPFTK